MLAAVVAACMLQAVQQSAAPDSFRVFETATDSAALTAAVRHRPDDAREALRRVLARAALPLSDSVQSEYLASAARLARAYASVWRDSFPMRQVESFTRWPPERRRSKVVVDSLRRAGVTASRQRGIAAAQRLWRASLGQARTIGDSAGEAAALGNIGAGFYMAGQSDSASAYLTRARVLGLSSGDLRTAANATTTLASVSKDAGDLLRARQLYSESRRFHERIGDVGGLAADANNLGLIAQSLGDLAEARQAFESALALNREYGRTASAATNLTNLANLATLSGDHVQALHLYDEALAIYRTAGDRIDVAFVLRNIGLLEMRRGDYPKARVSIGEALKIYETTGPLRDLIGSRGDLALVAAAMGDMQGALTEVHRAERSAVGTHVESSLLAGLALTSADLSVELNALAQAEREYARAARLYRAANDAAGQLAAREGRGILLLMRQDPDGALGELEAVARAHLNAGDRRAAAATTLLIGSARQQRGDADGARQSVTRAMAWFRAGGDAVGEALAWATLGDVDIEDGQLSAAETAYRDGIAKLGAHIAPDVAWRLHAGLGQTLQSRGAILDGVRELRLAVAEAERTSSAIRLEERRSGFLEDKWSVYAQLVLAELAAGNEAEAFTTSERLRARQMLSLIARGRIPSVAGSDGMKAEEQDLRGRIDALTNVLIAAPGTGSLRGANLSAASLDTVRERLDSAQRAYSALLLGMKDASPEYAHLVSAETVGWQDAAARLAPDEALVEYLTTDSTTIAFIIAAHRLSAVDLHVSRYALATLVSFSRANLARPDDPAARRLWKAPLRRLYQEIVAPIEPQLQGIHTLIIVPHGELHYLPFAALVIPARGRPAAAREQFLVERYVLAYTPSVSVWVSRNQRPAGKGSDRVLALAPRASTLPATRAEVEAIGRMYGARATVLTGLAASEQAFRAAAPGAEIIHLATNGVLNKRNPLFSFVELAPGGGDDGRLEVREALGMSLRARLLVLSACQTALSSGTLGDVPSGEDWIGLVQAFLVAGAARVMGTLWPVEDRATAHLMERFYGALSGGSSEAAALALAQRAALADVATAHPFYWAGLALFERGGD